MGHLRRLSHMYHPPLCILLKVLLASADQHLNPWMPLEHKMPSDPLPFNDFSRHTPLVLENSTILRSRYRPLCFAIFLRRNLDRSLIDRSPLLTCFSTAVALPRLSLCRVLWMGSMAEDPCPTVRPWGLDAALYLSLRPWWTWSWMMASFWSLLLLFGSGSRRLGDGDSRLLWGCTPFWRGSSRSDTSFVHREHHPLQLEQFVSNAKLEYVGCKGRWGCGRECGISSNASQWTQQKAKPPINQHDGAPRASTRLTWSCLSSSTREDLWMTSFYKGSLHGLIQSSMGKIRDVSFRPIVSPLCTPSRGFVASADQ